MKEILKVISSWRPDAITGPADGAFLARALQSVAGLPLEGRVERLACYIGAFASGMRSAIAEKGPDRASAPPSDSMLAGLVPLSFANEEPVNLTSVALAGPAVTKVTGQTMDPSARGAAFKRAVAAPAHLPPEAARLSSGSVCSFLWNLYAYKMYKTDAPTAKAWEMLGRSAIGTAFVADRLATAARGINAVPEPGQQSFSVSYQDLRFILDPDGVDSLRPLDTTSDPKERKQAALAHIINTALYTYSEIVAAYVHGFYATRTGLAKGTLR